MMYEDAENKVIINLVREVMGDEAANKLIQCANNKPDVNNRITTECKRTPLSFNRNQLIHQICYETNKTRKFVYILKYRCSDTNTYMRELLTTLLIDESFTDTDDVNIKNCATQTANIFNDKVRELCLVKVGCQCSCGSYNTTSKSIQNRSGDEPATHVVECRSCGIKHVDESLFYGIVNGPNRESLQ